jgi:mono/diheme cytochrome c family protein
VQVALGDPSRDVRVAAIRIAERWLREPNHPLHAAVLKLTADDDWAVRAQLAASLGELPAGAKEAALAGVLERHAHRPVTADAALSGMRGSEAGVLDVLLRGAETPQRSAALTLVSALIVGSAEDAPVQALFDRIADAGRPAWQRSALLRGAEVSLLGVPAPGTPAPRNRAQAAEAPCPTCPGGRAGPGGAPAFPAASASSAGRGRGNGSGPRLKLTREPALGAVAAGGATDLGARAAAVLARVEWPGKPGVVAAEALAPEEQARFDAGREVYQNLCVACHQADGRGREKMATSLVGSGFALAAPEIPIRVLINGKEGPVGLMPPLGGVLSDGQIASVLTYIRREWGNTGSPVDPATVARVRALVAKRTTPWTDSELSTLGGSR